jgi:hypothetical protein
MRLRPPARERGTAPRRRPPDRLRCSLRARHRRDVGDPHRHESPWRQGRRNPAALERWGRPGHSGPRWRSTDLEGEPSPWKTPTTPRWKRRWVVRNSVSGARPWSRLLRRSRRRTSWLATAASGRARLRCPARRWRVRALPAGRPISDETSSEGAFASWRGDSLRSTQADDVGIRPRADRSFIARSWSPCHRRSRVRWGRTAGLDRSPDQCAAHAWWFATTSGRAATARGQRPQ